MTHRRSTYRWLPFLLVVFLLASSASAEWKEQVLYSFQGGSDGETPAGGVAFDKAGNLYGVTYEGGSTCPSPGCGTIYQLSPGSGGTWSETVLYGFNGNQGSRPFGGAIIDGSGNLYGTTGYGGSGQCKLFGDVVGCGVVWELSPPTQKGGQWTYAVLYNFQGDKDGQIPNGDLTLDKAGNLYGATLYGGGYGSCNAPYFQHCGTVFELSPPKQKGGKWTEKVLYNFKGVADGEQFGDGANPNGGLVLDSTGAVYGTTYFGGNNQQGVCEGGSGGTGCGIVFELKPPSRRGGPWTRVLLHRFGLGQDGSNPDAGVVFGKDGSLYGTTYTGGVNGNGVVFGVTKPTGKSHVWKERVLYLFNGERDGDNPSAGLTSDSHGELYGTNIDGEWHRGVAFLLSPPSQQGGSWKETTLYSFTGPPDGYHPAANLIFDGSGALYGTTQWGGAGQSCQGGCGAVFETWP